jgi:hypothetical protein
VAVAVTQEMVQVVAQEVAVVQEHLVVQEHMDKEMQVEMVLVTVLAVVVEQVQQVVMLLATQVVQVALVYQAPFQGLLFFMLAVAVLVVVLPQ